MMAERAWLFVELVMGFRVSFRLGVCLGKNGAVEMRYSAPRITRS